MFDIEGVNGKVEVVDGETYWMGSKVEKCGKCGIAQTNVDDCGEFGNPDCPCWGIGREEYNKRYGKPE
jgi:hypothetical protein